MTPTAQQLQASPRPADAAAEFFALFCDSPLPMSLYDPETLRFVEVNPTAVAVYGYPREEFLALRLTDIALPEDAPQVESTVRAIRQQTRRYSTPTRWRHRCKDGRVLWMEVYSAAVTMRDGRVLRMSVSHDVSEMLRERDNLQQQSAYQRQLFQNSPEAIVMLDHEDRVVDANLAFETLFQYPIHELRGRAINDVIVPAERRDEASRLTQAALRNESHRLDTVRLRKDGTRIEVAAQGYPITVDGRQVGLFGVYREIEQTRRIAEELARQAIHDPLTRLLTRQEFERLAQAQIGRGAPAVLLSVDIDRFKLVNEGLGAGAGDRLLVQLADLLRAQLRGQDLLSRLGGDKFGVLLDDCNTEDGLRLAERIVAAVGAQRFRWEERTLALGVSIGLAAITPLTRELSERLRAADIACLAAKEQGRGRVHVFHPGDESLSRRASDLDWASRITESLEQGRYRLYAQKILPLNAPIAGTRCEVLLRLLDADGRIVLPGPFVAAAERYGLMPEVDRRLIGEVIARLHAQAEAGRPLPESVSVNLSGASLGDEALAQFIREQFLCFPLAASRLCFEITETAAIANIGRALKVIRELRELGASVSLDDFGAGMSSFSYLKSLTVDLLKIDGGFVRDLLRDPLDDAIIQSICKIARVRGIKTVAEWVESDAVMMRLRELGVDYVQGFHLHRPEPWESVV